MLFNQKENRNIRDNIKLMYNTALHNMNNITSPVPELETALKISGNPNDSESNNFQINNRYYIFISNECWTIGVKLKNTIKS